MRKQKSGESNSKRDGKIQKLSELSQSISFTEYDFYEHYRRTFENTVLGKMKKSLPLREMAESFGLVSNRRAPKRGRKPYMKDLDTMYTDATCYESEMRYPTDQKLLWECCERAYKAMCEASGRLGIRRPRTKYLDVEKANLGYAKCNNILVDGISFIEKLSFNAFNEGTRLQHCVKMHKRLFGVDVKKIGGDTGYAGTANRDFCKENGIQTSFAKRGRPSQTAKEKDFVRQELARVRATTMEGSFGTQKEHYSMRRIKARKKETEILYIFFGIHTANAVRLAERLLEQQRAKAA